MKFLRHDNLRYEFLPAVEEIIEKPAAPFGGLVIWLVAILLAVALGWSYFGKIDVVAVADGKISPESGVEIAQSANSGVISKINVREGQRVEKGEVLLELDKSLAEKDVSTISHSLSVARAEREILRNLLAGNDPNSAIDTLNLPDETKIILREFANSQNEILNSRRQVLSGAVLNYQQQLQANQQAKNRLELDAQTLNERKINLENQLQSADVIEKLCLQNELENIERRIASANDAATSQNQQISQSQLALTQAQNQSRAEIAELSGNFNNQIIAADKRISELENNLAKAEQVLAQTKILAPTSGTILSFSDKTSGGVVAAGEQIAQIVPEKSTLRVEANLPNQDVGFVEPGQRVVVKIATYPFQRYGYLEGIVEEVSPDSIYEEKNGLIYKVKIKLADSKSSKQNQLDLRSGMAVSAEITTGKRRIIEFFLDPLMTRVDESIKVR